MISIAYILIMVTLCLIKYMDCEKIIKPYLEDISIEFVNYTYIDKDSFDVSINYKPQSLNTLKVVVDVIEEIPENIMLRFEVFSRALGYNVPTGLSFNTKLCDGEQAKYYYDILVKPLGADDCPPKKGLYENQDYAPTFPGLPGTLLKGTHLGVDMQLYVEKIKILSLKALVVI